MGCLGEFLPKNLVCIGLQAGRSPAGFWSRLVRHAVDVTASGYLLTPRTAARIGAVRLPSPVVGAASSAVSAVEGSAVGYREQQRSKIAASQQIAILQQKNSSSAAEKTCVVQ